jgi:glutamine synthetase
MDRRVHKIECDIESSEEEEEQEVVDAVVEEMTQSKFIETSNSELDKSQSEINIRKTWAVRDFNRDSVLIKYEGYNKNLLQLTAI